MASENLEIVITAKDQAGHVLRGLSGEVRKASGETDKFTASSDRSQLSIGKLSTAVALGQAAYSALAGTIHATIGFFKDSIEQYTQADVAQRRLTQIVKTSRGATDAQVDSLIDQANALERVGVVTKDAIIQAQGQLASFDLTAGSIETLIPSMLNYIVAEKGVNASAEEAQAMVNGLAQALQGNFTSLTKTGFVLDEHTRKLISSGSETERVQALTRVLDSTYAGLNESMRKTAAGGMFGVQVGIDNIKEKFGEALLRGIQPFVQQFSGWLNDPSNQKLISDIANQVGNLAAQLGNLAIVVIPRVLDFIRQLAGGWRELRKTIDDTLEGLRAISRFMSIQPKNNWANPFSRIGDFVGSLLPGRATGGSVSAGQAYVVGENHPEVFVPDSAGRIIPDMTNNNSVTVNVMGSVRGESDIDRIIAAVQQALGRKQELAMKGVY